MHRKHHLRNTTGAYMNNRLEKIKTFYRILDRQEHKIGGRRLLRDCIGRLDWPSKGVYFFMAEGGKRKN